MKVIIDRALTDGDRRRVLSLGPDCYKKFRKAMNKSMSILIEQVLVCPRCGQTFFKVRRQVYCSSRCRNAVGFEKWETRHGKRRKKINGEAR